MLGHVGVEEGLWEVLGLGRGKKQKNKHVFITLSDM